MGDSSDRDVSSTLIKVQNFASKIDREWDQSYMRGKFDDLSRVEINRLYLPIVGVEMALIAGRVATASSRATMLGCLDEQLLLHFKIGEGNDDLVKARQLKFLEQYVRTL